MVLVCGELYDKAGQLSLNPSSSKFAMVIELNFGITCGVGVVLFERNFQNYTTLVVTRILILQMSCLSLIKGFIGIFDSIESPKIERWNNLIFFEILYTLWPLLVRGMTNFAGSWQRIRALRLVSTAYPSSWPLTIFFHGNLCGAQRSLLELLSFLRLPA